MRRATVAAPADGVAAVVALNHLFALFFVLTNGALDNLRFSASTANIAEGGMAIFTQSAAICVKTLRFFFDITKTISARVFPDEGFVVFSNKTFLSRMVQSVVEFSDKHRSIIKCRLLLFETVLLFPNLRCTRLTEMVAYRVGDTGTSAMPIIGTQCSEGFPNIYAAFEDANTWNGRVAQNPTPDLS